MQVSGKLKVKRHVLAENTTLHEVYHSVELSIDGPLTVLLEKPNFITGDADEIGFVCQLTPSGTLDFKFIPALKQVKEEDKKKNIEASAKLQAASKKALKAEAGNELGTLSPASTDEIEEEKKIIESAESDAEKARGDIGALGIQSPIKSELSADGELPESEDSEPKKTAQSEIRVPAKKTTLKK